MNWNLASSQRNGRRRFFAADPWTTGGTSFSRGSSNSPSLPHPLQLPRSPRRRWRSPLPLPANVPNARRARRASSPHAAPDGVHRASAARTPDTPRAAGSAGPSSPRVPRWEPRRRPPSEVRLARCAHSACCAYCGCWPIPAPVASTTPETVRNQQPRTLQGRARVRRRAGDASWGGGPCGR